MLIDTHCHLDFAVFGPDPAPVIARARAQGVDRMVVPAITANNFERVLELCRSDSKLHPALGLHPCFSHVFEHDLARLDAALRAAKGIVVAVGEIGLDFRPGQADAQEQERLLDAQLRLAKAHELPVLLHVVKAHDQVLKLLRRHNLPCGGIVHAFSGSEQQAHEYAKLGFKLGFGGALTYPRARKLRRLAAELPLEWLLLETDAPDMPLDGGPVPNEPAQLRAVAECLAALRQTSLSEVAAATSTHACALLQLHE